MREASAMAEGNSRVALRASIGPAEGSDGPLDFLVAPVTPASFFGNHYKQAPLLCTGREPDRFAPLLTLEQLDTFLDTADLRADMVALARSGHMLDSSLFVGATGRVIPSAVAEEYLNGATIIFQHLQDSFEQLGDFCRGLEALFSAHVQTNVYLTPPGAQGFAPHADTHDVFILQLAGAKNWRLRGHPAEDFTLRPGDSVYIPSGLVHEAWSAGDSPSLHITVGVIAKSWAELLAAAVAELAESEPELRRPLPPGHARADFDRSGIRRKLASLARRLADPGLADGALNRLVDDWLGERRPRVAGVLRGSARQPATRYRARPGTPWRLHPDGRDLILTGPGGDLRFAAADRAALEIILSGQAFAPEALPARDPQRLILRLRANGYVEPAPAP